MTDDTRPPAPSDPRPAAAPQHPPARRPWWREPLLHFLAIGLILFVVDLLRAAPDEASPPSGDASDGDAPILVSADFVRSLEAELARSGAATPEALQSAIDRHVEEEALVREARRLGLDRGDLVVRRRLIQKMEFLLGDLAVGREPTEAELQAWLDGNPDRYRQPPRVSFEHVWFSRDARGDQAEVDARAALAAGVPEGSGDAFLLGAAFERQSQIDVARRLGATFATRIFTAPVGEWSGPVPSSYGVHLVRVTAIQPGRVPALAEVRNRVLGDVREARRAEAERDARRALRERFEVVVQGGPATEGGG